MPKLGYEEDYVVSDSYLPDFFRSESGEVEISIDPIIFKNDDLNLEGLVECRDVVVDAFRGYSYCVLKDKDGNALVASGWIVDLDPFSATEIRNVKGDARVKYFISLSKDALEKNVVKITVSDVEKKVEELSDALDSKDKYALIQGYIAPWGLYLEEVSENPERRAARSELASELEKSFEEVLGP